MSTSYLCTVQCDTYIPKRTQTWTPYCRVMEIHQNPITKSDDMHQYANTNFSSEKICESFSRLYLKTLN